MGLDWCLSDCQPLQSLPELWGEAKPPGEAGVPKAAAPKPPEEGAGAAGEAEEGVPKARPLPKGEEAVTDEADAEEED